MEIFGSFFSTKASFKLLSEIKKNKIYEILIYVRIIHNFIL